jgi:hypothetical protein
MIDGNISELEFFTARAIEHCDASWLGDTGDQRDELHRVPTHGTLGWRYVPSGIVFHDGGPTDIGVVDSLRQPEGRGYIFLKTCCRRKVSTAITKMIAVHGF